MNKLALLSLLAMLPGCAAITAIVNFSKQDVPENSKISVQAKVHFWKVQEFRSMLEALEYRETAKEK